MARLTHDDVVSMLSDFDSSGELEIKEDSSFSLPVLDMEDPPSPANSFSQPSSPEQGISAAGRGGGRGRDRGRGRGRGAPHSTIQRDRSPIAGKIMNSA